jgi:hypothetical protein
MLLTLARLEHSDHETLGQLLVDGKLFCVTLEPSVPIPAGTYQIRPSYYYHGRYPTWQIVNIPDHDRVLIHIGNTWRDTQLCILVGQYAGWLNNDRAIRNSTLSFEALMDKLGDADEHTIVVKEVYDV